MSKLAGLPSHEWIANLSDALAASQAEVERLREALKPFAVAVARDHPIFGDSSHELISTTLGDIRRARAALAVSQPQGGE
jgi:hypothetical protein